MSDGRCEWCGSGGYHEMPDCRESLRSQLSEVTKERDELRANGQNEFDRHAETIAKLETALARVKELETKLAEADRVWFAKLEAADTEWGTAIRERDEARAEYNDHAALWRTLADDRGTALARAESAEASAAAMRGALDRTLDILDDHETEVEHVIELHRDELPVYYRYVCAVTEKARNTIRSALESPITGSDLLAELGALREVEQAARALSEEWNRRITLGQDPALSVVGPWANDVDEALEAVTAAHKGGRE